jgi:hypothetical protein
MCLFVSLCLSVSLSLSLCVRLPRFTAYDFHEATRGLHFENVAALIAELEDDLLQQKFCWESSPVPSVDWPAVQRALTGRSGPRKGGGSSARLSASPLPLPPPPPPTRPPPPVPNRPLPPLPSRPSAPASSTATSSSSSTSSLSRKLASLKASTVVTMKRLATEMQQAAANQRPDDPPTPTHGGWRTSSSRRLSLAMLGDIRVGPTERLSEQRGCFRVNCMDCLDRTNVVQSLLARRILHEQLALLGVGTDKDQVPIHPTRGWSGRVCAIANVD